MCKKECVLNEKPLLYYTSSYNRGVPQIKDIEGEYRDFGIAPAYICKHPLNRLLTGAEVVGIAVGCGVAVVLVVVVVVLLLCKKDGSTKASKSKQPLAPVRQT